MTSARRSILAATAPFALVAVTLVGGLGWATVSTYKLAKKNVSDEHRARLDVALRRIESRVASVLNSETTRPYTDYAHRYEVQPDIVKVDRRTLHPDRATVALVSPLAKIDPPYDWIDLHFWIDSDGTVGSPQIADSSLAWPIDRSGFTPGAVTRAAQTWEWLEETLPKINMAAEIAASFAREEEAALPSKEASGASVSASAGSESELREVRHRKGRATGLLAEQEGYLPPEECVEPIAGRTGAPADAGRSYSIFTEDGEGEDRDDEPVHIWAGTFAPPFWLEGAPEGQPKLAFVREVFVNAEVLYQGFVGDWNRFKPELAAEAAVLFPDADIRPIGNDVSVGPMLNRVRLRQIPAVLEVPGLPGGLAATAWRSIRGQVYLYWMAAVAILALAGWSVWTLVALANRRMQFAYAVTHELRTPLTTFRLYSDMLAAHLVPDSAKEEYLDTLNRESVRLATLVESVLEYARLENQQVKLHLTTTDGGSLLSAVSETLDKRCRVNGIHSKVLNHVNNGLPLRTDVNLVNQIAGVLINNAVRHARGSGSSMVLLELAVDGGRMHFDVADSGPGIAACDARHIFKPFRRGSDADASARGGVGLGLALARNWAQLLGGRLDLASRHHPTLNGAHFRLTIPTEPAQEV